MHTYVSMFIYIFIYNRMCAFVCVYVRAYVPINLCVYMHTYFCTFVYAFVHLYLYTYFSSTQVFIIHHVNFLPSFCYFLLTYASIFRNSTIIFQHPLICSNLFYLCFYPLPSLLVFATDILYTLPFSITSYIFCIP